MPSKHLLKGLNNYTDIFQRIISTPVNWDKKRQEFVTSKSHWMLIKWYFLMSCFALTLLSSVYVCAKELFQKKFTIPVWRFIIHASIGVFTAGWLLLAIFTTIFAKAGCSAWIKLMQLENSLLHTVAGRHTSRSFLLWDKLVEKFAKFGIYLAVLVSFFAIALEINPFLNVFIDLIPYPLMDNWFIFIQLTIAKYLFSLICLVEAGRMALFGVLISTAIVSTVYHCAKVVQHPEATVEIMLRCLFRGNILYTTAAVFLEPLAAGMLAVSLGFGVICNVMTISLYTKLPIAIYVFVPMCSFGSVVVPQFIISVASSIYENTCNVVHNLKYKPLSFTDRELRKYYIKKSLAVRPIGFAAGLFGYKIFLLKKSTKRAFLIALTEFTINVILTYHF